MTRLLLSLFVSTTALAVGLATTICQSNNHALGKHLDSVKRECDLKRAGNEGLDAALMEAQFAFDRDYETIDARGTDRDANADDIAGSADLAGVSE